MPFIEAPTTFYLGRRFDPTTRRLIDEVVYYDSRDLTTHAVVVGMTGSGKTGLCISLLEEAVMDNIPSIIIDPKGDITNLMLTFPEMRPEDFEPWVNVDDARRAGQEINEYAGEVAQQWRDGLESWGITPQRLARLKQNARFSIYTPGSDSGLPVSILDAMQAPPDFQDDEELHRERISGIVTALLNLVGKQVQPVKDREHVLIANIFEHAWRQGENLTLEDVILRVQKPPFAKLGVFDVNTFFPEKDRFSLAMELNNIIAAPSFQSWLQGEPLDIQSLLYTPDGKPRVSIFYIAHLNDAERMFIVTLLLENMLAWMRTLSGTTSLRSILYFDEVFGFFPPYPYNPPSKDPLLRLLKQARAFGVGLVLATQNPGDLDYKGLSNAGTWFIGKLQTENDKNRVLTGLESLQSANHPFDIDDIDRLLSTIDPRVFILHNVHDNGGAFPFYTRWAMSYLRGPLTRQQIRALMADQRQKPYYKTYAELQAARGVPAAPDRLPEESRLAEVPIPTGATPPPATLPELDEPQSTPRPATLPDFAPPVRPEHDAGDELQAIPVQPAEPAPQATMVSARPSAAVPEGINSTPPPIASAIAQYFLPLQQTLAQSQAAWMQKTGQAVPLSGNVRIVYRPLLVAQADVRYADRKADVTFARTYAYYVPDIPTAGLVHWDEHEGAPLDPKQLSQDPAGEALFADLPPGLADSKRLTALKSDVVDYIYRSGSVALPHNPTLDFIGGPDMRRRDFLVQAQSLARQRRDEAIDQLTRKYDDEFDKLEGKLRRVVRGLEGEREQFDAAKNEEMFTTGEALLSLLRGRTTYTLSRVSRTRRYKSYIKEDIYESEAQIAELERQLQETEMDMQRALAELNAYWGEAATQVEEYRVTPYKKDIFLSVFGIGWQPNWLVVANGLPTLLPAWGSA